jgi:hypothetical protein
MFTRASRLKQAALAYALCGWPVAPAAPLDSTGWPSPLVRCSCPLGVGCDAPGAHPLTDDWWYSATTDASIVDRWWSSTRAANVLLAPGAYFDAWLAPAALGETAAVLIRHDLAQAPIARTADDEWLFFTLPAVESANLSHVGVRRFASGDYLVAPPSWRGALRRDRWLTPPQVGTLPPWEPMAMLLLEASKRLP